MTTRLEVLTAAVPECPRVLIDGKLPGYLLHRLPGNLARVLIGNREVTLPLASLTTEEPDDAPHA